MKKLELFILFLMVGLCFVGCSENGQKNIDLLSKQVDSLHDTLEGSGYIVT